MSLSTSLTMNSTKKTTQKSIEVRLAYRDECQALTLIGAVSFVDDPYDAYLYPDRRDHYKEYIQIYRRVIEEAMYEDLSWAVVAESPGKEMMGYAIWTRATTNKQQARRKLRSTGLEKSRSQIPLAARLAHRVQASGVGQATGTCARSDPLSDVDRSTQHTVAPESKPPDYWYLIEVAFAPSSRFQGVGKALLEWGQRWAMEEDLPMLLEATRSDRVFYQRAGFVNYGVWRWVKEGGMAWDLMRWTSPESKGSL
jgi:GNAT superfamily N-acetyltransferase